MAEVKDLIAVTDGGNGLEEALQRHLADNVTTILDWYHAAEHCHFVPGLIRYANNHELLAMAAPRPILIIAASRDQSFPLAGVRKVADYGRTLYASWLQNGKSDTVVAITPSHSAARFNEFPILDRLHRPAGPALASLISSSFCG